MVVVISDLLLLRVMTVVATVECPTTASLVIRAARSCAAGVCAWYGRACPHRDGWMVTGGSPNALCLAAQHIFSHRLNVHDTYSSTNYMLSNFSSPSHLIK